MSDISTKLTSGCSPDLDQEIRRGHHFEELVAELEAVSLNRGREVPAGSHNGADAHEEVDELTNEMSNLLRSTNAIISRLEDSRSAGDQSSTQTKKRNRRALDSCSDDDVALPPTTTTIFATGCLLY